MATLSEVEFVEFGLYGDQDHKVLSCIDVISPNLYVGDPAPGGLYDCHMGTTDHEYRCLTCHEDRSRCPGHPGLLKLNCPLQQPIGIGDTRRLLRVLCLNCGTPMIELDRFQKLPTSSRLAEIAQVSTEGKKCRNPDCGEIHPKIIQDKNDNFTFWIQRVGETQLVKLRAMDLYNIFNRVTDETTIALGRSLDNHPRKLVLFECIQIPPVSIRPGIKAVGQWSANSGNDINSVLQRIVNQNNDFDLEMIKNNQLNESKDKDLTIFQQMYYELIQGSAAIGSSTSGKRSLIIGTKLVTSLLKRQSRKKGRIRENLKGKKVSDMCRNTISGNPKAKVHEVIIPIEFATTLRVFEIVQEFNKNYLMTLFRNGRKRYPGCSRIKKKNGNVYVIDDHINTDLILEVGDVVERDVITGDVCIFNRQPTLEISSIGGHRVVVNKDRSQRTIQMNVVGCAFYNADFDGDEMNLCVPKDPITRAEIEYVSSVDNFFISTKNSSPVNGQVQDGNIGCAEITRSNVIMNRYQAMCMFQIPGYSPPLFTKETYSGRDLLSMLLSKTPINFVGKPAFLNANFAPFMKYRKDEIQVIIENGIIKQGILDKKSVGPKINRGIYHLIGQDYGPRTALEMIYNMQQVVLAFLNWKGFTICTEDLLLPRDAREEIQRLIEMVLIESEVINNNLIKGNIIPPITLSRREFYEQQQINALKIKDEDILRIILNNIRPDGNSTFKLIATGSKGNVANLKHILGAIEQVTIDGERMAQRFGYARTLPYFPKFALDALAFGYVMNCYISGMTVYEYIFSSMNGRFDLINKALSTAETGYQYRKGSMSLESAITDYFYRTVKHRHVVQIIYGDDGLDPRFIEKVEFFTIKLSNEDIRKRCASKTKSQLSDALIDRIIQDRNQLRKALRRIEAYHFAKPLDIFLGVPANVRRILNRIMTARPEDPTDGDFGNLDAKINHVNDFCDKLGYIFLNDIQEKKGTPIPEHFRQATMQMQMHVRMEMNPNILEQYTFDEIANALHVVKLKYTVGLVEYGDLVSIKASQSVSEPVTQYMLDSHHRSVSGGTSKSGLEQVKQIFSDRPIEKEVDPKMLIRVKGDMKYSKTKVQEVANNIELITFGRFVKRWDRLYESYEELRFPIFKKDGEFIEDFKATNPLLRVPPDLTNWCIRFEISKINIVLKNITLDRIIERLKIKHPYIFVVNSKESNPSIVIRVYVRSIFFSKKGDDERTKVRQLIDQIMETTIRGVKRVNNVEVKKIIRHKESDNGALELDPDEYAIETSGTNLEDLLNIDHIDPNSVISTSIIDTFRVYGIEAARTKIINETIRFMQDSAPSDRHMKLFADEMTRTGRVTSLERKGLNKREFNNVLLRSAYSAPAQVFTEAALNNTKGPIYGISAPRLLGGTPKIGTLYSDVIIDEEFITGNDTSLNNMLSSFDDWSVAQEA
jgi:DNA-directed RNA polymerase II subunit RPB1